MAWFSTIWFHLWWVSFSQSFFFTRLWRTGFLSFLMLILSSRLILCWICQCTIPGCVFSSCWKKITWTLRFWRIWSRGNMNVLLQLEEKLKSCYFLFTCSLISQQWGCWSASQELINPSIKIIFPTIERVKNACNGILPSRRILCFSEVQ